jgi:hypothetical protein
MIYDTSYFIHPRYHVIIKASPRLHRLKVHKYLITSLSFLLIALSIDQDIMMSTDTQSPLRATDVADKSPPSAISFEPSCFILYAHCPTGLNI